MLPGLGRGPPAPGAGRGPPGPAAGRPAPGRAAPGAPGAPGAAGRAAGGRGAGADEYGLLPTRGARGPGLGPAGVRGPGAAAGASAGAADAAAGACGAGASEGGVAAAGRGAGVGADGVGAAGVGAAGVGADGVGAAGAGAAAAAAEAGLGADGLRPPGLAPEPGVGAVVDAPLPVEPFWDDPFWAAGADEAAGAPEAAGKDSRSRRATGASTVDDADLTNSPCSLNRARTCLLVTPSSFANSCTRALPATALLTWRSSGLPAATSDYVRNVLIVGTSRCAHVFCHPFCRGLASSALDRSPM